MAFGQNPGALFIGALKPDDKRFVASLLKAAKAHGYTKCVEPCSGQLAMSCIAADEGYEDLEASDVSIFSGVVGRYVQGRTIEDMGITYKANGETATDPVDVLCEIKRAELINSAGSEYGIELLRDFDSRREEIAESIKTDLDELKERVCGLRYFDEDMFDHIAAVRDDPHAIVLCMCPTYSGGYERFYRAINASVEWNEPTFNTFSPPEGYWDLLNATADAKCLFIMYEEVPTGMCVGQPSYGRMGGRPGINMYLVSNRPEEIDGMLGTTCSVRASGKMAPMKFPLMPYSHEITRKSRVEVVKAAPEHVRWYRKLFTHNFTPSAAGSGYAMIVDGYLAGVFGYVKIATSLGGKVEDAFLGFGMTTDSRYRLNRLLYMCAMQRRTLELEFDDLTMASIKRIKTAMLTKYQESKEMRGLMKLVDKKPDDRMGYMLTYECDMQYKTYGQVLNEFLQKEERWRKARARNSR